MTGGAVSSMLARRGTIKVIVRDEAGVVSAEHDRKIPNRAFHWFNLAMEYQETAGRRGTITFASAGMDYTKLAAFSLQFAPNGAFTAIAPAETIE